MREAEMVLSPGLMGWAGDLKLYTLFVGDRRRWPHGLPHGYHNPTDAVASLLCIDSPPFLPEDEIETGREPL
jgi:mannose-6-phosphate isomerase-like protein (cupin superfamily)